MMRFFVFGLVRASTWAVLLTAPILTEHARPDSALFLLQLKGPDSFGIQASPTRRPALSHPKERSSSTDLDCRGRCRRLQLILMRFSLVAASYEEEHETRSAEAGP